MLTPKDESELSEAIRTADGPLAIQGGGTHGGGAEGTPLSLSAMSGITTYEPGALTIVAKAGTPVAEIEATLAAENQMLAFEPMDHRMLLGTSGEPTIGGVVAGNLSGPRRVQAGACRDFLLGLRFVDGEGNVIKNGGRVMKNVTGYDLARLMCGSRGTLGVITEVSLKVLPRPETQSTLIYDDLSPDQAVPLMSAALRTPYDVSGAAFGPYHFKEPRRALLRIEGTEASVKYRVGELASALSGFGAPIVEADPVRSSELWRAVRDVHALADAPFVARIAVKPGAASGLIECVGQTLSITDHLDLGGGLVWMGATEEQLQSNAEQLGSDTGAADDLFAALSEFVQYEPGHIRLVKSPGKIMRQPEADPIAKLASGLRQKFDPRGILNPGLMG